MKSLLMDLESITKSCLVRGLGGVKEHSNVMVSLASLNPSELTTLSDETILSRFIASAEQHKGLKNGSSGLALYAAESTPSTSTSTCGPPPTCYTCRKVGHLSRDCRKKPKDSVFPAKSTGHQPTKKLKKIELLEIYYLMV